MMVLPVGCCRGIVAAAVVVGAVVVGAVGAVGADAVTMKC